MPGETGPISVSLAVAMVIAGFFAVAVYNTVEITVWLFSFFRSRRCLYFWSILVATSGILIHAIAVLLRFFRLAPNLPMSVLTVLGWWAMVTGQSVVLYSRLGLVVSRTWKTRSVLYMIIFNFCFLHIPVSILFLASNSGNPGPYIRAFNVYENIQLAGFTIQECIISGLYLWESTTTLKPILAIKGAEGRKLIRHLVVLFVVTVLLDSSLMATQYTHKFEIQTTYKPVVYSIKLKIEFVILNELLAFTRISSDYRGFRDIHTAECPNYDFGIDSLNTDRTITGNNRQPWSGLRLKETQSASADHIYDGPRQPRQMYTAYKERDDLELGSGCSR